MSPAITMKATGHHVDLAVGEVDHADDAVDHGVADGDQRIGAAYGQSVQQLLNQIKKVFGHTAFPVYLPAKKGW